MSKLVPGTAVIGAQWGDEAKGKIVDEMAPEHDIDARFCGLNNAGHSADGVALHSIPTGVIRGRIGYIASGCGVPFPAIVEEIQKVQQKKPQIDVRSVLHISPQASILQPHQILSDVMESQGIGTTGKGVGPHYSDKARRQVNGRRVDLRVGELLDYPEDTFRMMKRNLKDERDKAWENDNVPKKVREELMKRFGLHKSIDAYRGAVDSLRMCIDEDPYWLRKQYENGSRILLEGAQSEGLDLVRGTTPYVTSSRTGFYAALDSTSLPREAIEHVVVVGKLVTSRVGNGPFVSEFGGRKSELYCMKDEGKTHNMAFEQDAFGQRIEEMLQSGDALQLGQALRVLTGEYGVTSKRPRRVGAFDAVQFAQAALINDVTDVVLSKLDCMNIFSRTPNGTVPIVTGYMMNGQPVDHIPTDERTLRKVQPVYTHLPSFEEDISGIDTFSKLPKGAKRFVYELQDIIYNLMNKSSVRKNIITGLGVGPNPHQTIYRGGAFAEKAHLTNG